MGLCAYLVLILCLLTLVLVAYLAVPLCQQTRHALVIITTEEILLNDVIMSSESNFQIPLVKLITTR